MTTEQNHHHDADGIIENRERRPPAYFNILFFGLIIWAVIFMAYYLFSGWSSQEEFRQAMEQHRQAVARQAPPSAPTTAAAAVPRKDEESGEAGDAKEGGKLFAARCAMCHGTDGKGGIGPDLTGSSYRYGNDADSIRQSITNGRPKGMPAFGNQLSPEKIADLTAFVRSLQH